MHIIVESPIVESPRVAQVRGIFDLPKEKSSRREWQVELPLGERPWNIGLIVGPSGCGKSTIARRLFGSELARQKTPSPPTPLPGGEGSSIFPLSHGERGPGGEGESILDAFPEVMSIRDVVGLLSSVGFSSPPAWLRPFHVLSAGEQFRARLALLLAHCPELAVMDEYTSVVDRTVAQIGSAALVKAVRGRGGKFVAITCHEDVEAWLQPDWVYRPAEERFQWRLLQRRPAIELDIGRCQASAWRLFHAHHYLNGNLHPSAVCFLASWQGRPVAFSAWLPCMTKHGGRREHRTVTLPDYQGVGIGMALSCFCASLWKALGERAVSTTTHPAFITARLRSPMWKLVRRPSLVSLRETGRRRIHHAGTRLTAGFEYIGPPLDAGLARQLMARK